MVVLAALLAFLSYWLAVFSLEAFAVGQETSEQLSRSSFLQPGRRPVSPRWAGGQVQILALLALIGSVLCGVASLVIPLLFARYLIGHLRSSGRP